AYGALFDDLLLRYRFTPREESTSWTEAAVDLEMLGRAFESLMFAEERRDKGAFYTPLPIVARLVDRGLRVALQSEGIRDVDVERAVAGETLPPPASRLLRERLATLSILDPACG